MLLWLIRVVAVSFRLNILKGGIFVLLGCDTGSCDFENNSVSFCLVSISAYEVWVFVLCCASEELGLMQKFSRKSCVASELMMIFL